MKELKPVVMFFTSAVMVHIYGLWCHIVFSIKSLVSMHLLWTLLWIGVRETYILKSVNTTC